MSWRGLLYGAAIALVPAATIGATTGPDIDAPSTTEAAWTGDGPVRLVTTPEGNVARFRVREQLARLDFPNDAVGETREITGVIEFDAEGRVNRETSRFEVDLSALQSDSDRRDNFIRRRTLDTETYPKAVFVPTEVRGIPSPVPTEGELEFEILGEMTIRDVTRPVTWRVEASADGGAYIGTARTRFTFGTFELEIPRVGSVLSIRDDIRLEYDFRLVMEK